jgi:excisionase family DNA binding protein
MAKTPEAVPAFYSVDQTAQKLGLSSKTVRRLIASGELPVHRFGRSIRIADSDLMVFIKVQRSA